MATFCKLSESSPLGVPRGAPWLQKDAALMVTAPVTVARRQDGCVPPAEELTLGDGAPANVGLPLQGRMPGVRHETGQDPAAL